MKVAIIENKTGTVVARYPVTLRGLNYTSSDEEYFTDAWKCAVEQGIGNPDSRKKYTLRFLNHDKRHQSV